jgi:protein TonB
MGPGGGAAVSSVPSGDGPGGIPAEYGPYLERYRRRVQDALFYPLSARRQGLSGTVEIEVLLEPSGRVSAAKVLSSSSHAVLDAAAIDAVKRLDAEPFPASLPRRPLRIRLPLAFELR